MPSARSKAINLFTRIATQLTYRKPRPVVEYRPRWAKMDDRARVRLASGLAVEEQREPVEGRWIRNTGAGSRVILYLHGGAFILRIPNTHTAFAAQMCEALDAAAFLPWYRLAPEHPFPAAPEDCLEAYRYLLDSGRAPEDIVVMGDSAGGNLALSILHLVRKAGLPFPGAVVALSPITDFAQVSATWRLHKWRDPMYIVQGAVQPQRHYLQGASPLDPVASPYYGDLGGFPPTLVVVGGVEAMLDDSVSYVKKAVESAVDATVHIWKGMPHVFPIYDLLPESSSAREMIVEWANDVAAGTRPGTDHYKHCVRVFDRRALTGRMRSETNDVYLVD